MKARTIGQFNAALQAQGMNMVLIKGCGYLYFTTLDPLPYDSQSEMVYAFNHLTTDQWTVRAREAWATFGYSNSEKAA